VEKWKIDSVAINAQNISVLTGSDEEQALVKALHYAFPTSTHMFCMIHCKDNVGQHMIKTGISLTDQ